MSSDTDWLANRPPFGVVVVPFAMRLRCRCCGDLTSSQSNQQFQQSNRWRQEGAEMDCWIGIYILLLFAESIVGNWFKFNLTDSLGAAFSPSRNNALMESIWYIFVLQSFLIPPRSSSNPSTHHLTGLLLWLRLAEEVSDERKVEGEVENVFSAVEQAGACGRATTRRSLGRVLDISSSCFAVLNCRSASNGDDGRMYKHGNGI